MSALSIKNIERSFGSVCVLKDITIDVPKGDFLVLLGPSGCGKSTLLSLIAGLDDITGGELRIDNRLVNGVASKDRDIAMVFQSYALYPSMSVRDNIAFGLRMRGEKKVDRHKAAQAAAEMLRISHLLDRKPGQLSGGQRQRVAMARALVRQPKIFLFDEPLSNLDAQLRTEMRAEIKKLHDRLGTTIVYVTHDQIEAMTMATKIAIMNEGHIVQYGTPDDIYRAPADLFVAKFIGSPTINLIKATVVESGKGLGLALVGKDGEALRPLFDLDPNFLNVAVKRGQEVTVGIRPEILNPLEAAKDAALGAAVLEGTVSAVENTGCDLFTTLAFDGGTAVARLRPGETSEQASLRLTFDPMHALIFDAQSGQRINKVLQ